MGVKRIWQGDGGGQEKGGRGGAFGFLAFYLVCLKCCSRYWSQMSSLTKTVEGGWWVGLMSSCEGPSLSFAPSPPLSLYLFLPLFLSHAPSVFTAPLVPSTCTYLCMFIRVKIMFHRFLLQWDRVCALVFTGRTNTNCWKFTNFARMGCFYGWKRPDLSAFFLSAPPVKEPMRTWIGW